MHLRTRYFNTEKNKLQTLTVKSIAISCSRLLPMAGVEEVVEAPQQLETADNGTAAAAKGRQEASGVLWTKKYKMTKMLN